MPSVGSDLWFFPDSSEFGDSLDTGQAVPLAPETVLYRAAYVGEDREVAGRLDQARERLATFDFQSREDIYLLRPTTSWDGAPFRTVLIYRVAQHTEAERFGDPRVPQSHRVGVFKARATRDQAIRVGSSFAWETGHALGREAKDDQPTHRAPPSRRL